MLDGQRMPLYQAVATRARAWGPEGSVGLVVGATYPSDVAAVRAIAPTAPLLLPGVGAQAGDLSAAVRAAVDARGERAIVNAARQVLYASAGDDWLEAARRAAEELRRGINLARGLPA
jgi:orotidine-5'-phosphate decarboxylase